jgi:hypothetical protein
MSGDQLELGLASAPKSAPERKPEWMTARDEAMERVERNADDDWREAALEAVRTVALSRRTFIVDDVRQILDELDVVTRDKRALGPVMLHALKLGWIGRTGDFRASQIANCHGNPRSVWRSNIVRGITR